MTDSSLAGASGAFAEILAARAAADHELGRKASVRTVAAVLVAALHVLFIAVLLIVQTLPSVRRGVPKANEIELVLAPALNPTAPPKVNLINPREKKKDFQEFEPRPITILPPPIESEPKPKTPTDVMQAIRAELDCGASRYEYLGSVERKICHRAPWKAPNDRNLALAPPPPAAQDHMTGADAATRIRETASPCPPSNNGTPCLDEVIHGKGPH